MDNKRFLGQTDLEHEIMKLEEILKNKKDQLEKLRLVNENGKYVLISTGGINELNIEGLPKTWKKAIKQNNVFKTRKDAEKERDRRELLYEFNQFKNERNNGWTPNWNDATEWKTSICFGVEKELKYISTCTLQEFVTFGYFRNVKDCIDAIEKFGDRIKKLFVD